MCGLQVTGRGGHKSELAFGSILRGCRDSCGVRESLPWGALHLRGCCWVGERKELAWPGRKGKLCPESRRGRRGDLGIATSKGRRGGSSGVVGSGCQGREGHPEVRMHLAPRVFLRWGRGGAAGLQPPGRGHNHIPTCPLTQLGREPDWPWVGLPRLEFGLSPAVSWRKRQPVCFFSLFCEGVGHI